MDMVKTTIMLDDQLYKQLVNEAIERYGSTRKLSLLINEKLKGHIGQKKKMHITTMKLGRRITEREIEKAIEEGWNEAIKWSV